MILPHSAIGLLELVWKRRGGTRPTRGVGGRAGWNRRSRPARLGVEGLEGRALLSVGSSGDVVGAWAASSQVDPASSVLVRFTSDVSAVERAALLESVSGREVTAFDNGPIVVALAPWASATTAIAALEASGEVVYAEANQTIEAAATPVTPNDPNYGSEWGLSMIQAPLAWSVTTGSSSTIVAVLDTGIDLKNAEFSGRLWVNSSASTPRQTVYGWNFANNNGNTQDNNGHGTHVAGVIAAAGNNALGIAGVNWNTRIMPLKVLDSAGNGSTSTAISAIYFAVNNGARVINASWGGDLFSSAMRDALNFANSRNVVFVTAAGNESSNNDVFTTYPASYRTPNELVVAGLDRYGHLADYSNYGATSVDIAAPGSDILSTVPGGYDSYTGTSMATPFVSGTVALLAGLRPTLTAEQLVTQIRASARPTPALQGVTVSGGILDAYRAVTGQTGSSGVSANTLPNLVPNGTPLADLETYLAAGDEVYNALGGTPEAFVSLAFRSLLGREPEASALSYFTDQLNSGQSRVSVYRAIQGTTEALRTRVARWYLDVVGWPTTLEAAKASSAVGFWANSLASGQTDGAVLAAILGSDGYYTAVGSTPATWVDAVFRRVLNRPAEADAQSYFSSLLASGRSRTDVARTILGVVEARRVATARLLQNEHGWTTPLAQLVSDQAVVTLAGYLWMG